MGCTRANSDARVMDANSRANVDETRQVGRDSTERALVSNVTRLRATWAILKCLKSVAQIQSRELLVTVVTPAPAKGPQVLRQPTAVFRILT